MAYTAAAEKKLSLGGKKKKKFDDQYRFTPVLNNISGPLGDWYDGTMKDML